LAAGQGFGKAAAPQDPRAFRRAGQGIGVGRRAAEPGNRPVFQGVGLTLLQGYGQTESGPIASVNRPSTGIKMDTVGTPLHATEVKIAADGEILLRGELVMHGYWRNEAETARVLKDGWLHTGDIGHIDAAGRIVITDRKRHDRQ
jgi:long-chain acyl-CoA synthetase